MKVVGIIAEFNPFHNGHRYILERAKEKTGADYCVVVMSGSFVQRGTPAFMDKYTRTNLALQNGADLVLELPVSYSTATAEAFAFGGVSLLDCLGIVDFLAFGSESGDIDTLKECAHNLLFPSDNQQKAIENALKKGLTYPAARSLAFEQYKDVLKSPNNILGIEYLKVLEKIGSGIIPVTITRIGSDYHDLECSEFSSAEGIRSKITELLSKNNTPYKNLEEIKDELKNTLGSCYYSQEKDSFFDQIAANLNFTWPIESNDCSELVKYMLLTKSPEELSKYQDMNIDIARRFKKTYMKSDSLDSLLSSNKTKELTYTRLSRGILHCLLELTDLTRQNGVLIKCPYSRILGFKKDTGNLMRTLIDTTSIPLVNKCGDAKDILSEASMPYYEATIKADRLYDLLIQKKYGTHQKDGCLISPIII